MTINDQPSALLPYPFCAREARMKTGGDYREAYSYCRLGAELAERSDHPAEQARALLYLGGIVGPWRAPLAESVPLLRRAHARHGGLAPPDAPDVAGLDFFRFLNFRGGGRRVSHDSSVSNVECRMSN